MPIERLSIADAQARLRGHSTRIYPSEKRGVERLRPFARPETTAGFQFGPDAKIFATGSCFARNVEKSLAAIGATVTSSPLDIPVPDGASQVFQLYNKYTIHSILNEVEWALDARAMDPAALLLDDTQGRFYDLQVAASSSISGDFATMERFRRAYNSSFRAAAEADVVIITLGLVECWYDLETGVYLNMAPPPGVTKAHPGRFEFHVLDYNDVLGALMRLHEVLCAGPTPPKLLVTVSPVGLAATFRPQDVLVANTYSKAVQRAAVEAFTLQTGAAYFPSYEYVTLTDQKFAWGNKDFRHVRQETVDRIMADVLLAYVGPSRGQRLLEARGTATAWLDAGDMAQVQQICQTFLAEDGPDVDLLWLEAQALRRLGNQSGALAACRRLIAAEDKARAQNGGDPNKGPLRSAGRTALNIAAGLGDARQLDWLAHWYGSTFPDDLGFLEGFG